MTFLLSNFSPTFRTKRRLSVAPLPALRLNDKEMIANEFDSQSVISNQASIASATSITSLLKEKMQVRILDSILTAILYYFEFLVVTSYFPYLRPFRKHCAGRGRRRKIIKSKFS